MHRPLRRVFTTAEALGRGMTMAELRWGEQAGRWRRLEKGVYAQGPAEPSLVDRALGAVVLTGGVASDYLAGELHGLDSVAFSGRHPYLTLPKGVATRRAGVRHRRLPAERITSVDGIRCTDGLQTLVDLAASLDDTRWEHALEYVLRRRLSSVAQLEAVLPELGRARHPARAGSAPCCHCVRPARRRPRASSRPSWSNWCAASPVSASRSGSSRSTTPSDSS